MNCQVCLECFDFSLHKPIALTPCGHSFCLECLNNLNEQHCPKCRQRISDKIPNYAIIEVIDMRIFSLAKQIDTRLIRRSVNNYGYIEWKLEDKAKIITKLIDDLKPRNALQFIGNLPAYVILMCIRYSDLFNHEDRAKSLINSCLQAIKRLIKAYQTHNTLIQNEQSLKNLNLIDYYSILDDTVNHLCSILIKQLETKLTSIIISAILEYDYDAKITTIKNVINIDSLIEVLNDYMNLLVSHTINSYIIEHIFKYLFNFINCSVFNKLIFRVDLCNRSKGISLSYNITVLERWQQDNNLKESYSSLETLKQASQLLTARKTHLDISNLAELCSKLTLAQIENILIVFTPVNENYENHINRKFINEFLNTLKEFRNSNRSNLIDEKLLLFDLKNRNVSLSKFEFNPTFVCLELIEIPEQLGLNFLIKF